MSKEKKELGTIPTAKFQSKRKFSECRVISFINQKGGVGKTTMTTLIANMLHFHYRCRVAILDLDMPQFSIAKRQAKMKKIISSNDKLDGIYNLIYEKKLELDVFGRELSDAPAEIDKLKNDYDILFVDITGTVHLPNVKQVYLKINYFFIPTFQDGDTFLSTMEFYKFITNNLSKSPNYKACKLFFNKIPTNSNQLKKYLNLVNNNIAVFDSILHQYRIYEKDFRSTLFPIPLNNRQTKKQAKDLYLFCRELLMILKDYKCTDART